LVLEDLQEFGISEHGQRLKVDVGELHLDLGIRWSHVESSGEKISAIIFPVSNSMRGRYWRYHGFFAVKYSSSSGSFARHAAPIESVETYNQMA
jgi:hypothetical protein